MILIAGPCQVESFDHAMMMAREIAEISQRIGAEIIFKSSFDKANRTSGNSPRGAGMGTAMSAFRAIHAEFGLRILTDVHEPWQCDHVAGWVDVLQIPALLCRQTDLIEAAARTGRTINIKKGQFLRPADMRYAVGKAVDNGADDVWVTERGTSFGYGDLVVDMRSIGIMGPGAFRSNQVIYDATHSVQTPGSAEGSTGGQREFIEPLARAAIAAGADGIFIECHDNPDAAPSDGAVMLPLPAVEPFLKRMIELHRFVGALH